MNAMGVHSEENGYVLLTKKSIIHVRHQYDSKRLRLVEVAYLKLHRTGDCGDRDMSWWRTAAFEDLCAYGIKTGISSLVSNHR